jgi:hypothetical protein
MVFRAQTLRSWNCAIADMAPHYQLVEWQVAGHDVNSSHMAWLAPRAARISGLAAKHWRVAERSGVAGEVRIEDCEQGFEGTWTRQSFFFLGALGVWWGRYAGLVRYDHGRKLKRRSKLVVLWGELLGFAVDA